MDKSNNTGAKKPTKEARHLALGSLAVFFCLSALITMATGCATTASKAKLSAAPVIESIQPLGEPVEVQKAALNPYKRFSAAAETLKFPPSAGAGAYWGDGRFNITLNNFYDEQEGPTCLLQQLICFRQEGKRVYAAGKEGVLVLDLVQGTYKTEATPEAFDAGDQAALKRLLNKSKDNVYFNSKTMMPDL